MVINLNKDDIKLIIVEVLMELNIGDLPYDLVTFNSPAISDEFGIILNKRVITVENPVIP